MNWPPAAGLPPTFVTEKRMQRLRHHCQLVIYPMWSNAGPVQRRGGGRVAGVIMCKKRERMCKKSAHVQEQSEHVQEESKHVQGLEYCWEMLTLRIATWL